MEENENEEEVITHFKGPGQWRSQARRLEAEDEDDGDTED